LVPADEIAGYPALNGALLVSDGHRRCWEIPDYSPNDADRAWIASNLGDVPMRIFDTVTNVTLTTVESLGRES